MKKKHVSYKDELRHMLIVNVITPVMIVIAIGYIVVIISGYKLIEFQNIDNNKNVSIHLESNILEYRELIKYLSQEEGLIDAINAEKNYVEMYDVLYKFINKRNVRSNFYIFDKDANLLMGNKTKKPEYMQVENIFSWGIFRRMKLYKDDVVTMVNNSNYQDNIYGILTQGKAIVYNDEIIGYIIFDILEEDIFELITGTTANEVLVVDRYNIIGATNSKFTDHLYRIKSDFRQKDGFKKVDGKYFYIYKTSINTTTLYVYTITDLSFFNKSFLVGGILIISVVIMIYIAMLIWARKLSVRETKSIDNIVKAIKAVQEGNLDTKLHVDSEDEFKIISDQFNKMLDDIKELINKNKEEVNLRMLVEIKQLEAQFNPHFLFNTLEVIRVMIKLDKDAANTIIIKLSSLLRYSIKNDENLVQFREDIEYINSYLEILKYRFGSKLSYSLEVDEKALSIIVPKLLIQPLIENAIKYGFGKKDRLNINIKAIVEENKITINIKDDGDGIASDRLEDIRKNLDYSINSTESIGIFNINRRIKLIYGKEYGVVIDSNEGIGTEVQITIPVTHRGG